MTACYYYLTRTHVLCLSPSRACLMHIGHQRTGSYSALKTPVPGHPRDSDADVGQSRNTVVHGPATLLIGFELTRRTWSRKSSHHPSINVLILEGFDIVERISLIKSGNEKANPDHARL